jgi:hypothetical protein
VVSHLSTAVCAVHVTESALPFTLAAGSVHTMFIVLAASTAAVVTAAVAVAMLVRAVTGSAMACSNHDVCRISNGISTQL